MLVEAVLTNLQPIPQCCFSKLYCTSFFPLLSRLQDTNFALNCPMHCYGNPHENEMMLRLYNRHSVLRSFKR